MPKSLKYARVLVAIVAVTMLILLTSCGGKPADSSAQEVTLEGVHLEIAKPTLGPSFPIGCTGTAPACMQAPSGYKILSVTFQPRDLPEGQMLAYKNLPSVRITMKSGEVVPYSLYKYDNTTHTLTLGFEVPEGAADFRLKWADQAEIPLNGIP